jgi:hypothetical protein
MGMFIMSKYEKPVAIRKDILPTILYSKQDPKHEPSVIMMSPDMRQVTPKLRYKFTEAASLYMTSDTKLKPYRLGREQNISNTSGTSASRRKKQLISCILSTTTRRTRSICFLCSQLTWLHPPTFSWGPPVRVFSCSCCFSGCSKQPAGAGSLQRGRRSLSPATATAPAPSAT